MFAVVFNGDVECRCESKRFNVSLVTVVVVVVDGVLVEVRHGVFITSRRIGAIAAAFDDVSGVETIGSGTIVVVVVGVVTAGGAAVDTGVGDPPLATSSITSSICERDVDGDCFSPLRFDDETMFETNVISSAD